MNEPENENLGPQPSRFRDNGSPVNWTVVIVTLIVYVTILLVLKECMEVPTKTVQGVGDAVSKATKTLADIFNLIPKEEQTITVVHFENTPIAEFAVIEKEILQTITIEITWMFSKKIVLARGKFSVKAGFDLKKPFFIRQNSRTGDITAQLPDPEILSITLVDGVTLWSEDGIINRVNDKDRQRAINLLIQEVRRKAEQSGILEAAKRQSVERFKELAKRNGQNILFDFGPPPFIQQDVPIQKESNTEKHR